MAQRPPETFRIPTLGYYWLVYVAETGEEMRAELERTGTWEGGDVTACAVAASDLNDKNLAGMLFFSKDTLGVGLVAHELAHAVFRTYEREGRRIRHWQSRPGLQCSTEEETFCETLEEMCAVFWREVYQRDLARPA
jgi:hypothetical protein